MYRDSLIFDIKIYNHNKNDISIDFKLIYNN